MQVIETINQWLVHHNNKQKTVFWGLHWPNICVLAGGLEHFLFSIIYGKSLSID